MNQDLISRQAILKHIEKKRQDALMIDDLRESNIIMMGMKLLEEAVRNQPSVQPKHTETHSCDCEHTGTHSCVYEMKKAATDIMERLNDRVLQTHSEHLEMIQETHDLVSRKVVIDAVKQHMNNVSGGNDEYYIAHRHIIELLKIVPTAEPESRREWYMHGYRDAQPRWIPVTERLPDDLEEVNITFTNIAPEPYYDFIKGKRFTGSAVFYKGEWYWYSSITVDVLKEYGRYESEKIDDGLKIVAWMPLPDPYREEEQDD